MTQRTSNFLSKATQWIAIIGSIVGVLTLGIRTIDLTQQTAQSVKELDRRVSVETEERKQADIDIRSRMSEGDRIVQAELSQIRLDIAVVATDVKYLVKALDAKGSEK
jgi:hypothetical protein